MDKPNNFHHQFLKQSSAHKDALRAIVATYDLAIGDARTKIPTPLHMAVEQARRLL